MSTLSVTICSTRNAKWFEKIKKLYFWQCFFFQKITKRGQKVKFDPIYLKAWAVFTRKGFGDTEVLWNIVYRSQILVLYFLSLSFPCYFVYWAICTRPKFVPTVTVSTICFYFINLHLQLVYLQLHLPVFAFLDGGQLLPAAEVFCDYS